MSVRVCQIGGRGRVRRAAALRGFTLVEMIVVVAIIGLILAIAVPALNNMSGVARLDAAVQTINGALTRAYYASQADMQMSAIRFLPGAWDFEEKKDVQRAVGRQHAVSYSYVGATDRQRGGQFEISFRERFERRPGVDSIELPSDIYVAPIEAWRDPPGAASPGPAQRILDGEIGKFALDPTGPDGNAATMDSEQFFEADDFLMVFDPRAGLVSNRTLFPLRGYDPTGSATNVQRPADSEGRIDAGTGNVVEPYRRYSSAGVVVYRREALEKLGPLATWADRQEALRRFGRPYYVHRFGGGLVMGSQESR